MRAGPKAEVTAPRLNISRLPRHRAARCIAFTEGYLRVTKGVGARRRVRLRPWQRAITRGAFAPGVRQGLITMPRGNGKTTLAACLAAYGLFADNVEGAQVLAVASDHRQAAFILNICRRMIELDARRRTIRIDEATAEVLARHIEEYPSPMASSLRRQRARWSVIATSSPTTSIPPVRRLVTCCRPASAATTFGTRTPAC